MLVWSGGGGYLFKQRMRKGKVYIHVWLFLCMAYIMTDFNINKAVDYIFELFKYLIMLKIFKRPYQ